MAKELYEAFPERQAYWVYGFICENYLVARENEVVHKLITYERFKRWLFKKGGKEITLEQFHNELMNIPLSKTECIVDERTGEEYYTHLIYEPEELNPIEHSISISF